MTCTMSIIQYPLSKEVLCNSISKVDRVVDKEQILQKHYIEYRALRTFICLDHYD